MNPAAGAARLRYGADRISRTASAACGKTPPAGGALLPHRLVSIAGDANPDWDVQRKLLSMAPRAINDWRYASR